MCKAATMRIGILGGTGPAGRALAARLGVDRLRGGHRFAIEVPGDGGPRRTRRQVARSRVAARRSATTAAADCDVVVIATPWDSAATTAQDNADQLAGKVVVSMANALVRVGHEFQPLVPPRGSVAAHVQAAVPGCRVVAAFHHLPATELGHLGQPIDSDVLICGDDPAAVETISEIVCEDSRLPPARCRRAVERDGDRGVHRRAAAAQRALQDPRRAEADGHPHATRGRWADHAALRHGSAAPSCRSSRTTW